MDETQFVCSLGNIHTCCEWHYGRSDTDTLVATHARDAYEPSVMVPPATPVAGTQQQRASL